MVKTKTFTQSLEIFKTARELESLDQMVNTFLANNEVKRVIAVSDATTSGESGTIGIIRVVTYEV